MTLCRCGIWRHLVSHTFSHLLFVFKLHKGLILLNERDKQGPGTNYGCFVDFYRGHGSILAAVAVSVKKDEGEKDGSNLHMEICVTLSIIMGPLAAPGRVSSHQSTCRSD